MELLLLWPLFTMIRSDFKERQVRLAVLLLFGAMQWGICVWQVGIMIVLGRMGENLLLLLVWTLGIGIYLRVCKSFGKGKSREYIGKGDLAFIGCLLPVFPLRQFLLFLLVAMSVGLIYWLSGRKSHRDSIPLVSMLGICYLPILILRLYGYG